MNIIHLMGRLTRDPEIRVSKGEKQTKVAKFSIAVDRRFSKDETDFFNCTAFGKQADFVESYLQKGTKMVISGRMQCDRYTDKDGAKRTAWGVIVDEMEFAESKKAAEDTAPASKPEFIEFNEEDEELPFNFG